MAKIHWALACLLLFVTAAAAQEHYTEGPVWRVTLVRVKPAQMDAYLTSLRQATKPLLEEEKRTGAIIDYKIFLKETNSSPQDWDFDATRECRCSPRKTGRDFSRPRFCIQEQTFVCFPNQERNLMIVMNVTKIHAERLIQPPA